MQGVLTKHEREMLENRPRKRIRVKRKDGYVRVPKTRPGNLAKFATAQTFAEKWMNQVERYGWTPTDRRIACRLVALLEGQIATMDRDERDVLGKIG